MSSILSATSTGVSSSNLIDITTSSSHDSTTSTALIKCTNHSLSIGDYIVVTMGYIGDIDTVFKGYVKQIERNIPNDTYTITAHDSMIRAVDHFIASTNPENPLTYSNIAAEILVRNVLQEAGLSSFSLGTSYFSFGIQYPVEVNLVSSYDFANMVGNLIAWEVWSELVAGSEIIYFHNRKPYPMDGTSGQPDDTADSSIHTFTDSEILNFSPGLAENDLRNRVVVYGATGIFAESSQATSYNPRTDAYEQIVPTGFYKTAVAASQYIDSQTQANNAADYNLALYNRLADIATITVLGNQNIRARKVVTVNSTRAGINADYYVYFCEQSWSEKGFTTTMQLRR